MNRATTGLLVCVLAGAIGALASDHSDRDKHKRERLEAYETRLKRAVAEAPRTDEERFLEQRATELMERARKASAGSYVLSRLLAAVDDVLDATDGIREAAQDKSTSDVEKARRDAARDLERSYLRVKQGGYFSRQSQDSNGPEYVKTARRLYQLARAQYDAGNFRAARKLAGAARETVNALENLAQAAVPVPEPPRM